MRRRRKSEHSLRSEWESRIRNHQLETLESRDLLAVVSWTGGRDGFGTDWFDGSNWSGGRVPSAADEAIVPSKFRDVRIEKTAVAKQVVVEEGAAINLVNAEIDAAVSLAGTVNVYGASSVAGSLETGRSSAINIVGTANTRVIPRPTDSSLTVARSFTNNGVLRLRSDSVSRGEGDNVGLIVQGGSVTNNGTIELVPPEHGEVGLFQIDATINNESGARFIAEPFSEARRDQPIQASLVARSASHTNEGVIAFYTADVVSESNSRWTNLGQIYLDRSVQFDPGRDFLQQRGTTENHGQLGPASEVVITGGDLSGGGTVDANVAHQRGSISPGPTYGRITITGNLIQQSSATTRIDVGGTDPGRSFDQIVVQKEATLDGNLILNRIGDSDIAQADIIVAGVINNKFANNNASEQELRLFEDKTTISVATQTTGLTDAEAARLEIVEGLEQLGTITSSLDGLFDLAGIDVPLFPSDVLQDFDAWSSGESQLGANINTPSSAVQTFADLRGALADLGFQVTCMQSIDACPDGSIVQARLVTTTSPLSGSLDTGAALTDLLEQFGLANESGLSGTMQLTGTLGASFAFGVDASGFYLTDTSGFNLDLTSQGDLSAAYDLSFLGLGVTTSASSGASGDFQIQVRPSNAGARVRISDLQSPLTTFSTPTVDGTAVVDLGLLVGIGDPTDLELTGVWTIPVTDNQIGTVDAQLDAPEPQEIIGALAPVFRDAIATATEPVMDVLNSIPIPMLGGDPQPESANPTRGLVEDIPVWFDQITSWINHKFEYISNVLFGAATAGPTGPPGQGMFYTQGDTQLRALDLRNATGATGRGIKIGVISDTASVNGVRLARGSGDLPAAACTPETTGGCLTVLTPGVFTPGRDEGIAMLEIIHDIAPEAQLYFASGAAAGNFTPQAFATAVSTLAAAGMDIIVDDLFYVRDPFFDEDQSFVASTISQLIDDTDTLYVTAAGNETLEHLQDTLRPVAAPAGVTWHGGNFHNFAPNATTDISLPLPAVPLGTLHRMSMQWSDTFLNPTQRYIMMLVDPAGVPYTPAHPNAGNFDVLPSVGAGPTRTDATSFAYDEMVFQLNTATPVELAIVEVAADASKPQPIFKIITRSSLNPSNNSLFQGLCTTYAGHPACPVTDQAIFGHPALTDVLAVGAINSVDSTGAANTALNAAAPYSQHGGSTVLRDSGTGFVLRDTLDVLGIDAVQHSGPTGYGVSSTGVLSPFQGTSAAAPHVAAVAALLSELHPDARASDIRHAIEQSAVDVGAPGYDRQTGHGRVDAFAANGFLVDEFAAEALPRRASIEGEFDIDLAELFDALGIGIESLLSADELWDLMRGELNPASEIVRLSINLTPTETPPVSAGFGFDWESDVLGSAAELGLRGKMNAALTPDVRFEFGFDGNGFFVHNQTRVGGQIDGDGTLTGRLGEFEATGSADLQLTPSLTFLDAPERMRLTDLPGHILGDSNLSLGTVQADLELDLKVGLLDYVDVDPSLPNTENGGDPFIFRGTTTVTANLDSFDIDSLESFEYDFSNVAILNPDIDDDGTDDYTLGVLGDNLIELGKDLLRGERSLFGLELSGAFDSLVMPLIDNPVGEWLGLQDAIDSFLEEESNDPGEQENPDEPAPAIGDIFDFVLPEDLFESLGGALDTGLATEPFDLARIVVNLDEIPMGVIDENVNFDLQTILPDSLDVEGRAGIENAKLNGQLVFGIDTSLNPLYLQLEPDALTPDAATSFGGSLDIYVNVSGEPLGSGIVTLDQADARVSPEIQFDFESVDLSRIRIGSDLFALTDVGVSLTNEEWLQISAAGLALTPGPFRAAAEDDDENDDIPAVSGAINVYTGEFDLSARRFVASFADVLNVVALPEPRLDENDQPVVDPESGQPIIDPGVAITFDPAADPNETLVRTPKLQATLDLLTVGTPPNELTPEVVIEGITVDHSGQVSIPAAELTIPDGYLNAAGVAGFLPVEINRARVEFPDPSNLDAMTVCTTGEFLADDLSNQIESLTGVQVTPILQIGDEATSCDGEPSEDNQFDFQLDIESLSEGKIEPYNLGPITLGLADLQVGGSVLDGQITLGGYQNGAWNPSLAGFFQFQTDPVDPSDDDLVDLNIVIDSERSSLSFDGDQVALQVTAEATLDADISGPFGNLAAGGSLGFTLGVDAQVVDQFPFVEVTDFRTSLGELTIDSITLLFDDVLQITAEDITLNANVNDPATDPYGTVGSMEVEILAFQNLDGTPIPGLVLDQTSVELTNVELFQDELRLSDVTFHLDGSFSSGGTTLLDVNDAKLRLRNFAIPNPFDNATSVFPSLDPFFDVGDVTLPQIDFELDHAILFPSEDALDAASACETDQTGSFAAVCGVSGSFSDDGVLTLSADDLVGQVEDIVRISATNSLLNFGPNVANDDPLLAVGLASVTVPVMRSELQLDAFDLTFDRTGAITVTGAQASATSTDPNTPDGVLNALGLGDFLPFDVTAVSFASLDDSPIRLDELTTPNFEVGVDGYFDFEIFNELPVKPIIRMDGTDIQSVEERDAAINPFEFSFAVTESGIAIKDTGLITLGFEDLTVGPLVADAAVTLGRFSNGEFEAKHLNEAEVLTDGVLAEVSIDWDQGDGDQFDFATGAWFVGTIDRTLDAIDPNQWTTTLDLDGQVTGSLNLAGEGDDAWRFMLDQLALDFGFEVSVDETLSWVPNPDDAPVFTFDGVSAQEVELGFGPFMTMAATNVAVDFTALQDDVDAPFISFGGQRPTRPQPTADEMFPATDVDQVNGELSVTFGGPLEGLGGKAGNFGIGYRAPDPNATEFEFPLEFYQLEDFFVALQVPDDFKFGMPDWLPLSVTEIGLRFPDSLGDLLPFGGGDSDDGDSSSLTKTGLDLLTDFSLLFSGGLESREGGWPLQGLVEDVEVNVETLADCAEHVASQVDLNGIPYDEGLEGLGRAIREQGITVLTSITDCSFPIENLDAVDIGVEPFELGPIEIGGGLGFGTIDVVDADGNAEEVLFGRIEGQFAYSDVGIGAELIVTEYGPVLARLFAGVPIPIGTLVGSLAGSVVPGLGTGVGASLGTQSGFILTGFQGGLVFDGEPLPPVTEPLDLLTNRDIRFPLDMNLSRVRDAVQTAVQNDTMTWSNGFTFAASGTLTNIHVHGMVGATVTLGANVGFSPEEILGLEPGDTVPDDAFSLADDEIAEQACGQSDLGALPDLPVGLQLFGFGSLDVLGQSLVDVGLMFDYSDPINPALYLAGAVPQPGSLLSLIIPGEATAGIQLCTDGIVEGSVIAMQTFVEQVISGASDYFDSVMQDLAITLDSDRDSILAMLVLNTNGNSTIDPDEANRTIDASFLTSRLQTLLASDFGTAVRVSSELLQFLLNSNPPTVVASRQFLRNVELGDRASVTAISGVIGELADARNDRLRRLIQNVNTTPQAITDNSGRVIAERQFIDTQEASLRLTRGFVLERLQTLLSSESDPATQLFVANELVDLLEAINPNVIDINEVGLPQDPNDPINHLLDTLIAYSQAAVTALEVPIDPTPIRWTIRTGSN